MSYLKINTIFVAFLIKYCFMTFVPCISCYIMSNKRPNEEVSTLLLYEIERLRRDRPYSMTVNHFHDHYEIYYLLSGKRYYFIQDRSYLIQEGDLVFIDKNELHKTRNADDHHHERILLSFDDSWIRTIDEEASTHLLVPFGQKQHIFSLQVRIVL